MKQLLKIGLLCGALALSAATASQASVIGIGNQQYSESYTGTSTIPVSKILTANVYPDTSEGFTQAGQFIDPPTYLFTDPFPKDSKILSTNTFFFGESQDTIITDGPEPPATHLIVAIELAASQDAIGHAFSDFFTTGPSEGDVLGAIDTLYSQNPNPDDLNAAVGVIFNFISAANSAGALFSATGGAYNLVSFSDGVGVGQGTAFVTPLGGVPEPATWALAIVGLGLTGAALRRRAGGAVTGSAA